MLFSTYIKFCDHVNLVDLLASLWRADAKIVWMLTIPDDCKEFQDYFDDIQEKISRMSVLDDLLAGNMSY